MAAFIDRFRKICDGSKILSALILLNTFVWIIAVIFNFAAEKLNVPSLSPTGWLPLPDILEGVVRHPWTILTYMVTQFSFLHLLFNMLWLYWFGKLLLITLSDRQLLFIYISGGLAGALLFLVSGIIFHNSGNGTYLCGASSAVLAVMTVDMFRMPDMRCNLLLIGEVKLKWLAPACILLTLIGESSGSTGSIAAHFGGILSGLVIIIFLKKGIDLSKPLKHFLSAASRKTGTKSRRLPPDYESRPKRADAFRMAAEKRLPDSDRLDQLLDKIRISGYNSLNSLEKRELNAISRRINEKN